MLRQLMYGWPMALLAAIAVSAAEPSTAVTDTPQQAGLPCCSNSALANRVWLQTSKEAEPGALRIFLANGTMLLASDVASPAIEQWLCTQGRLYLIEQGIRYSADILQLTETVLTLQLEHPAGSTVLSFVAADQIIY
ncbi:hypothetical protein [Rheinheimera sp. NSM]|uniref:hypothetical protein n=1 Tax=Rheinheimera sp. NSM TaxID=3457884 RepID=UPI0040369D18